MSRSIFTHQSNQRRDSTFFIREWGIICQDENRPTLSKWIVGIPGIVNTFHLLVRAKAGVLSPGGDSDRHVGKPESSWYSGIELFALVKSYIRILLYEDNSQRPGVHTLSSQHAHDISLRKTESRDCKWTSRNIAYLNPEHVSVQKISSHARTSDNITLIELRRDSETLHNLK